MDESLIRSCPLFSFCIRFPAGRPLGFHICYLEHLDSLVLCCARGISCLHSQAMGRTYLYAAVADHAFQAVDTPCLCIFFHAYGTGRALFHAHPAGDAA